MTNCIYERKKLRTNAKFKIDMKFESYLDLVNDFKTRRCLTRFRLEVHDLEIERGRYVRKLLPITERRCKLCSEWMIQVVEDEKDFLLHCPFYLNRRMKLYVLKSSDKCIITLLK